MSYRLFLDQVGDSLHLAERASTLVGQFNGELPTGAELRALSARHGTNMASSVLHQSILRHDKHGPFIEHLEREPASAVTLNHYPSLFIVPGLFYREFPEVGGHGGLLSAVASRFGINTQLVPTHSRGSIQQNIGLLHEFLSIHAMTPFWLASVSRGSAEVKWLLQLFPDAAYWQHLKGWVSFNGVVRGSGLLYGADVGTWRRQLLRALARVKSVNPALIDELHPDRPEWRPLSTRDDIFRLNVISVPMDWDVTAHVQKRYARLCNYGPNDGVVTLGDYTQETGYLYPLTGVDHLLRTEKLSPLFYRLIRYLFCPAR